MTNDHPVRGFRAVLSALGALYVLLATSMLVRGAGMMRDFEVPASLTSHPVFEDFFTFFYQLMAGVGVLVALLGQVARDRRSQVRVAAVLCAASILITLRDTATSDTVWGNRLYRGSGTLILIYIDAVIALVLATLLIGSLRRARPSGADETSGSNPRRSVR